MYHELVQKATEYAYKEHYNCNHLYDGRPYVYHLRMVFNTANKFIHLIPEDKRHIVLAACWVHDIIEDARQTYNDVKAQLGEEVAEIAYALTNEKGKTRQERANDKYYDGIRNTPYATFVKLCDRIANVEYSISNSPRSSMLRKYHDENPNFQQKLIFNNDGLNYREMFHHLHDLLNN